MMSWETCPSPTLQPQLHQQVKKPSMFCEHPISLSNLTARLRTLTARALRCPSWTVENGLIDYSIGYSFRLEKELMLQRAAV